MNAFQDEVNIHLNAVDLARDYDEWAFLAIILPTEFLDLKEIVRRSIKKRVMEFRLKIDHGSFLAGSFTDRIDLIADALSRSVGMMGKFKVPPDERQRLKEIVQAARNSLCDSSSPT